MSKDVYEKPIFTNDSEISDPEPFAVAAAGVVYLTAVAIAQVALIGAYVAVGGIAIGVWGPSCQEE